MFNKLVEINNYYNNFTYVSDEILFNKKDYWQTPLEFESNKCGDCEDFAIAKFFKLQENDIDSNLVYCFAYGKAHMVCLSGDYILDNIIKNIVMVRDSKYQFIYTFNTEYWQVMRNNIVIGVKKDINTLKLWKDLLVKYNSDLY